ncbi:MAG: succinylglutamate desuccinylase/aspartoacylase family protein [Xenococcaceae cyanobacterium]
MDELVCKALLATGTRQRLEIPVGFLPTQTLLSLPVTVINGVIPGPRLWLSAAIHGDEINGVEIIRQVLSKIDPKTLQGSVIAVPIVNVFGFIEQTRYLPDRRDLNRCFPGSATGSLAARLAHLFIREIVSHSTHGIDLHTASDHRINLPQIRANLEDLETYSFAKAFGAPIVMHSSTRDGSLRQAAANLGIPVLLYEAGEALRFDGESIRIGVEGILRVMDYLGMYKCSSIWNPIAPTEVKESKWIRATHGGILRIEVALGDRVRKKQPLGIISDAFGDNNTIVRANFDGIVISHTQNPLVNQGDGIVHLGLTKEGDRGIGQK